MTQRPNHAGVHRRRFALAALVWTPVGAFARSATGPSTEELMPTPAQSLGPFYPRRPEERPAQVDSDLIVVDGDVVLTRGVPLYLTGRVVDRAGRPQPAALVEIWQCDANAVYHHPAGGAVSERDPHFQGYGQARTEVDGRFHFRTIRPVPYPGRTPHIHVRVEAPGRRALGTQLYLPDAPGNGRDFLYRHLRDEERARVTLAPQPTRDAAHPLARNTQFSATVDLVLG